MLQTYSVYYELKIIGLKKVKIVDIFYFRKVKDNKVNGAVQIV